MAKRGRKRKKLGRNCPKFRSGGTLRAAAACVRAAKKKGVRSLTARERKVVNRAIRRLRKSKSKKPSVVKARAMARKMKLTRVSRGRRGGSRVARRRRRKARRRTRRVRRRTRRTRRKARRKTRRVRRRKTRRTRRKARRRVRRRRRR